MSASGPILDPHIHQWDQRKTPRKASALVKLLGWHRPTLFWVARRLFPKDLINFFARPDHVLIDYLWPDYEADTRERELAGFVHVQAGWEGRGPLGPVGETRWLESLGIPQLRGIVGHADLGLGSEVEPVLAAHVAASKRFRGIRYMLAHHPDPGVHDFCPVAGQSRDPRWREGYALLAKFELSFDAWVYHHQLDEVGALARDFPEVPVILCHAGSPVGYGGPFSQTGHSSAERTEIAREWREGMSRLADQPNVSVKLSGLAMPILGWGYHEGDPPETDRLVEDLGPLLTFVIDTFGAERCFFASNFPVDKVSVSWATLYEAYERVVAGRSADERRALFHDNAVRAYRLET